jgi:hypothetical protein
MNVWTVSGSLPEHGEIVQSGGRLLITEGPFESSADISGRWVR